jgi:hypothetical protein
MRNSTSHQCRKCGAHIRSGLDNDAAALVARVDDEPVTRQGELLAILNGRRTYSLEGGRLYLRERHHLQIPARAPYVQHRCWEPFPATWLAPTPRPTPVSAAPPF